MILVKIQMKVNCHSFVADSGEDLKCKPIVIHSSPDFDKNLDETHLQLFVTKNDELACGRSDSGSVAGEHARLPHIKDAFISRPTATPFSS